MLTIINEKWFGWIPTNRGKLNFNFIEIPSNIKENQKNNFKFTKIDNSSKSFYNMDISYLSDSYKLNTYLSPKVKKEQKTMEYPAISDIEFELINDNIKGKVDIIYEDFCTLSSTFDIELNGIISFSDIYIKLDSFDMNAIDNIVSVIDEIKTIFYILVKTLVHGDAHHHQKIDIALPIIKDDDFNALSISSALLDYIKLVEKNVKSNSNCESLYRKENLVYEIEGYISYFNSFYLLFKEDKIKNDLEFAKNIFSSLKSTVEKRKNKDNFKTNFVTASIAFAGLFISTNILLNGFWFQNQNNILCFFTNESRFIYMVASFIIILWLFSSYIGCKAISYAYYEHYEWFELTRLIKKANFSKLSTKGKLIKSIPIILIIIAVVVIVRGLV